MTNAQGQRLHKLFQGLLGAGSCVLTLAVPLEGDGADDMGVCTAMYMAEMAQIRYVPR